MLNVLGAMAAAARDIRSAGTVSANLNPDGPGSGGAEFPHEEQNAQEGHNDRALPVG